MIRLRSEATAAQAGTAFTASTFKPRSGSLEVTASHGCNDRSEVTPGNKYNGTDITDKASPVATYDYMGRRVQKKVYSGSAIIGWTLEKDTKYVYDLPAVPAHGVQPQALQAGGWNLILETTTTYDPQSTTHKTFVWGLDLSQTTQGAGGVGGLLAVTEQGATPATYYATYDANGNVSEYLDSNGATVAHYEYSPFGRTTVATGAKAADFAHRFSAKYLDEHGLYYYGMRSYSPELGRWVNRDPVGERGGRNIYALVENLPLILGDLLGLEPIAIPEQSDEPQPPGTPGEVPPGEKALDWAEKMVEIYGSKLQGVIGGAGQAAAWVSSVGMAVFGVAYGAWVADTGALAQEVAKKQAFCNWYYNIRFNEANSDLNSFRLVTEAPSEHRSWVKGQIDSKKGGKFENGLGYRAAIIDGNLLYMVWHDDSAEDESGCGICTSAAWRAAQIKPGEEKSIAVGLPISTPVRCCNNHGQVPER